MHHRFATLALLTAACCSPAAAQTVRFDTNVGSFDMVLNPTGLDSLEPHVENLLQYIDSGRYHGTTINRAPEGFVLQMGSFITDSLTGIESPDQYNAISQFDDVIVDADGDGNIDFDTSTLTNQRGTVSLALSNSPNSGASSFFINIGDNAFLDDQNFIPFAVISDMTVVDEIMALSQQSLDPGLTFSDVPFRDDGTVVVINDTNVVGQSDSNFTGPIGPSASTAALEDMLSSLDTSDPELASAFGSVSDQIPPVISPGFRSELGIDGTGAAPLPEPAAATLLALGAGLLAKRRRR